MIESGAANHDPTDEELSDEDLSAVSGGLGGIEALPAGQAGIMGEA